MKITFVDHAGGEKTVETPPSGSLMEAAKDAGIDAVVAICGGACSCSTCMVYIDEPHFAETGAIGDLEEELLSVREDRRSTSRLSCQVQLTDALDGMRVVTPESQE